MVNETESSSEGEEKSPVPGREQKSPKIELTDKNAEKCLCPDCPTFMSEPCPEDQKEKIYCSIGMTECGDLEQKGCLCGNCQVFTENDLKVGYFCVKGEANELGEPVEPEAAA